MCPSWISDADWAHSTRDDLRHSQRRHERATRNINPNCPTLNHWGSGKSVWVQNCPTRGGDSGDGW